MRKAVLTGSVALVIIFGHLGVFFTGLLVGVFRLMIGSDALQTLLMASPVLASTAVAALTHMLTKDAQSADRANEDPFVVVLCLSIPLLLLSAIFLIFILFYWQVDGFGPDQLKLTLGALESAFGAFLGAISKKLFGGGKPQSA
ncbi:hypothetical protein IFT59_05500 [Rhizobium sp. CFBP 8752]|uniref:hypothetical protein n=1 Tax=Rhizobium sp. CFBP 8752 TaxID=2775301 RepID=UPI00178729C0|nr:hypothetical protein [Rhizobium sp. CFBP 8752]MBD8662702.1 hypothetical protein [Rhizobium sp. CFBP 8752]